MNRDLLLDAIFNQEAVWQLKLLFVCVDRVHFVLVVGGLLVIIDVVFQSNVLRVHSNFFKLVFEVLANDVELLCVEAVERIPVYVLVKFVEIDLI